MAKRIGAYVIYLTFVLGIIQLSLVGVAYAQCLTGCSSSTTNENLPANTQGQVGLTTELDYSGILQTLVGMSPWEIVDLADLFAEQVEKMASHPNMDMEHSSAFTDNVVNQSDANSAQSPVPVDPSE